MKRYRIDFTTATDGTASQTGESAVGLVYAVQLVDGDLADGVDVTLTSEHADLSIPILVKADFNSDQMVYPRVLEALNTSGANLTTHTMPLSFGQLKVVIAQGGSVKSGSVIFYIKDE